MRHYFLITAYGKDRPGMVASLTRSLYKAGANLEDASMTRLGGEFTMMLTLSLPATVSAKAFQKTIQSIERKSRLTMLVRPIPAALARRRGSSSADGLISVYGIDKPGLVFHVADLLSRRRVNITDLQTKVLDRPSSPLYVMLLEVTLPRGLSPAVLRRDLERVRLALNVDLSYQEIEPLTL